MLELLRARSFLFVMEGGEVSGIITPSDLQRVTVSMVVLSLVLAAEAGIDELIRHRYGTRGLAPVPLPQASGAAR